MSYTNPEVPHEVNVSQESDIKTFFHLASCVIAAIVAVFFLIYFTFKWLAPFIPFHYEEFLVQDNIANYLKINDQQRQAQARIQTLANHLAEKMEMPKSYRIRILLNNQTEKNAFATLGGNIIVTQGLLDHVTSENALAMVVGHEIAHVKNRDPLVSAGSGIVFNLLLALVTGGNYGMLETGSHYIVQSSFSRKQERVADALSLHALNAYYGHVQGAQEFFTMVLAEGRNIEFLSSHPDTQKRLTLIEEMQKNGNQGILTPLPAEVVAIQKSIKQVDTPSD